MLYGMIYWASDMLCGLLHEGLDMPIRTLEVFNMLHDMLCGGMDLLHDMLDDGIDMLYDMRCGDLGAM